MIDNIQDWQKWRKFINENWPALEKAYEKCIEDYFNSINWLHVKCLQCKKYEDTTCGGWSWKEDPTTHECIKFININK